jgi:hypothetical protein
MTQSACAKQPKQRKTKARSKSAQECKAALERELAEIHVFRSRLRHYAERELVQRTGREKGYLV